MSASILLSQEQSILLKSRVLEEKHVKIAKLNVHIFSVTMVNIDNS